MVTGVAWVPGQGGTISVTNCNISFNEALSGGGLRAGTISGGDIIISHSVFLMNHAYQDGGGLYISSSTGATTLSGTTRDLI